MEKIEEKMKLIKKKATIYELFNEILDQKIYEERLQEWKSPEVGSYLYKQKEIVENIESRLQHDQPVEVKLDFDNPDRLKERFEVAITNYCRVLVENYNEEVDKLNNKEEKSPMIAYSFPANGVNKKGIR